MQLTSKRLLLCSHDIAINYMFLFIWLMMINYKYFGCPVQLLTQKVGLGNTRIIVCLIHATSLVKDFTRIVSFNS